MISKSYAFRLHKWRVFSSKDYHFHKFCKKWRPELEANFRTGKKWLMKKMENMKIPC